MKKLIIIFIAVALFGVASSDDDFPLGTVFTGHFGPFTDDKGQGVCGNTIDYSNYKAAWIAAYWFNHFGDKICQYCIQIAYNNTIEIYPITDKCSICDADQGQLSLVAFEDFADPGDFDEIQLASYTFINCPPTTSTNFFSTTTATKSSTTLPTSLSASFTTSTNKALDTTTSINSAPFHDCYFIKFLLIYFVIFVFKVIF